MTIYRITLADRAGPWTWSDIDAPRLYGAVVRALEAAPPDKILHVQVADDDAGLDDARADSVQAAERCVRELRSLKDEGGADQRVIAMAGFRDNAWSVAKSYVITEKAMVRDPRTMADAADMLAHAREWLSAALYWRDRLRVTMRMRESYWFDAGPDAGPDARTDVAPSEQLALDVWNGVRRP